MCECDEGFKQDATNQSCQGKTYMRIMSSKTLPSLLILVTFDNCSRMDLAKFAEFYSLEFYNNFSWSVLEYFVSFCLLLK